MTSLKSCFSQATQYFFPENLLYCIVISDRESINRLFLCFFGMECHFDVPFFFFFKLLLCYSCTHTEYSLYFSLHTWPSFTYSITFRLQMQLRLCCSGYLSSSYIFSRKTLMEELRFRKAFYPAISRWIIG